jgi:hypothetical protein
MKIMRNQVLMTTHVDSQGERCDRQMLQDIVDRMPPRYPLGQHHDAALPSRGYIENFRLEELVSEPGQWQVVGDVHIEDDLDFSKFGGFSYSSTEIAKKSTGDSIGALYIPYPLYKDQAILDEITSYDPALSAGRWIKKNADPSKFTFLVTFILFVLTPAWKKIFDERVWPFLINVIDRKEEGSIKNSPFEYVAIASDEAGRNINIYFIPDRNRCKDTFSKVLVKAGMEKAIDFLHADDKAIQIGADTLKLYYHDDKVGYKIFFIQYRDGTSRNII